MADTISDAVRVTARILPLGVSRREFGITLCVGWQEGVIAATSRDENRFLRSVSRYANLSALTNTAGVTQQATDAGTIYFQQSPFPRNFVYGTLTSTPQPALAYSSTVNVSGVETLGDGVQLIIDDVTVSADFDGDTTLTQLVASLNSAISDAAVTVEENDGEIVIVKTGGNLGVIGAVAGNATSASAIENLGLGDVEVMDYLPGGTDLDRLRANEPSWYWITHTTVISTMPALQLEIANWAAARPYEVGAILDLQGRDVLVTNESTSLGAQLSELAQPGVAAIWNDFTTTDHKAVSYASRFSSVNFAAPDAVPNGKFLQLPGTRPVAITASERAEVLRKNVNLYTPAGDGGDTEDGRTFATWIDTYYWISWFKNAIETATYNLLKQSAQIGGIPITDTGLATVEDAISRVCEEGVTNGGIAPNTVSPAFRAAIASATNNPGFDGVLSTGYIVIAPPAASISQAVRNSRGPIPVSVFVKGSGRINSLEIQLTVEQ